MKKVTTYNLPSDIPDQFPKELFWSKMYNHKPELCILEVGCFVFCFDRISCRGGDEVAFSVINLLTDSPLPSQAGTRVSTTASFSVVGEFRASNP